MRLNAWVIEDVVKVDRQHYRTTAITFKKHSRKIELSKRNTESGCCPLDRGQRKQIKPKTNFLSFHLFSYFLKSSFVFPNIFKSKIKKAKTEKKDKRSIATVRQNSQENWIPKHLLRQGRSFTYSLSAKEKKVVKENCIIWIFCF